MSNALKSLMVITGAVVCSTLAINASDLLRGLDGNLVSLVGQSGGVCGDGAVILQLGTRAVCVDRFEASASDNCPVVVPENQLDTAQNVTDSACTTESVDEVTPWRFVSLTQAQQLCARSGKRLPSNEEWYKAVLGMSDVSMCAVGQDIKGLQLTGASSCVTPSGIHDMVGNVWEWVDEEVVDGRYQERLLPESGYVALVDTNGVVIETSVDPQSEYGEDYAWTNAEGIRGIIRGGFYGSESDAGLFTVNAAVPLDFRATGVGFRCVKDV